MFDRLQLYSLGRAFMQVLGTYVASTGIVTGSEFDAIAGGVVALVGVIAGQIAAKKAKGGQ